MERLDTRRETDRKQEERLDRLELSVNRIETLLGPISETYTTASVLGKWVMGALVFASVIIGIVLGLLKIIHVPTK